MISTGAVPLKKQNIPAKVAIPTSSTSIIIENNNQRKKSASSMKNEKLVILFQAIILFINVTGPH